jgi:glycosyltransferase involved in cell wall biosynthesis
MVLLEAMSQGLATIATPVGAAPSLIRDGETGVLIPARDAAALAAALQRLIGSAEERRRLGQAARERVRSMTWSAAADQTLAVYEDALGERLRRQAS